MTYETFLVDELNKLQDLHTHLFGIQSKLGLILNILYIQKNNKLVTCEVVSPTGVVVGKMTFYKSLGKWRCGSEKSFFNV